MEFGLPGREGLTYANNHSVICEKFKGHRQYPHDALCKRDLNIVTDNMQVILIFQHILPINYLMLTILVVK